MIVSSSELRLAAVEIPQGPRRTLYAFGIDGKTVHRIATISRVRRSGEIIEGYQRPEVLSHIAEIRSYLESTDPMIPNAIVIAFDSRVHFEVSSSQPKDGPFRTGVLTVPVGSEPRPGFIVDGQQRLAAIRDSSAASFPIVATAFITDDIKEQTEQFILVNATKPLPKSLIYELLPGTAAHLPTHLRRKRFPSMLLDRLNRDDESPFRGRIQTPTTPSGTIKDNSVLRMLDNSLSEGGLYRLRADDEGQGSMESMLELLNTYWGATADVFKEAWSLPPKRSRLTHGCGIVSMGFLMDAMADRHLGTQSSRREAFLCELRAISRSCRWTHGFWEFGPGQERKWNELQNTSGDIQRLSNYLLVQYRRLSQTQPC